MTIIHVVNHFLPRRGGVELSVACTAEAHMRRGNHVTVITETPALDDEDRTLSYQVLRFSVPILRPFTRLLYWRWMWRHRALLNNADVLHFHDYTTFIHWFLPLRAFIRKPLYAVTFHGFEQWPVRLRHRAMRNLTARLTHARFAVGQYIASYYGHAIDAFHLGAPVRTLPKLRRGEDAVFAYVGRLAPDTGILHFAEGLRDAARQIGIDVELRLAGDGPQRETLAALDSRNFRVLFHGVVDDPIPVYDGARYLIATGFLALYDAFQTGIPVIIPAYNEMKQRYIRSIEGIETMALVLDNDDASKNSLQELLLGEQEGAAMLRAAAASAWVADLGWDAVAAMTDDVYQRKLSRSEHTLPHKLGACAFV